MKTAAKLLATIGMACSLASCIGLAKREDATEAQTPETTRARRLTTVDPQASLFRSSGKVTALRLKKLFPQLDTDKFVLGIGGTADSRANAAAFISDERPSTALAQLVLRDNVGRECTLPHPTPAAVPSTIFTTTDIRLNDDETFPTDASELLAFAGVRNAWLYPYAADAPEVLALAASHRKMLADGLTANEAKKLLCMAIVLAPQFWMGNPGKYDVVRKTTLELARRLPTFAEYEQVITGAKSTEQFVKDLQSEPGYLATVKDWHKEWLGLQSYSSVTVNEVKFKRPYSTSALTVTNTSDFDYVMRDATIGTGGSAKSARIARIVYPMYEDENLSAALNPEHCDDSFGEQAFDPVTTRVQWELWNHLSSPPRWEQLAAHVPNPHGAGKTCAGAAGTTPAPAEAWCEAHDNHQGMPQFLLGGVNIGMKDISFNSYHSTQTFTAGQTPDGVAGSRRTFAWKNHSEQNPPSILVGHATYGTFMKGALRIRRFGSDGQPQSGFSKVKLWFSKQEAYVCNNISRIVTTCFDRPIDPRPYQKGFAASRTGKADGHSVGMLMWGNGNNLDRYRCGVPNEAEIAKDGLNGYDENVAFPKTGPYNDLTYTLRTGFIGNGRSSFSASDPEIVALTHIAEDMANEPYHLIEDILKNRRDYRLLLTANYTFGRPATELWQRVQGHWLPTYPTGSYLRPGDNGFLTTPLKKISSDDFADIPRGFWRRTNGTNPATYSERMILGFPDLPGKKLAALSPRPMSGILTQTAFIQPMSPKIRSLVSRVFTRLMCNLPSAIPLDPAATALHTSYMFKDPKEVHLDKDRGCYQCHVHLDPMGKALSVRFAIGEDVEAKQDGSLGEMGAPFTPDLVWGIQGNRSIEFRGRGAVLGKEVSGVQGVAQAVADSKEFAACVVQKSFENVFGRNPAFPDAGLLKSSTDKFMKDYDYDALVRRLATSEEYVHEN